MPAGSVCVRQRNDIKNEEANFYFIGGYESPNGKTTLKPVGNSISFEGIGEDTIIFKVYFKDEIQLVCNPYFTLMRNGEVYQKTEPCLRYEDGMYCVEAEFHKN